MIIKSLFSHTTASFCLTVLLLTPFLTGCSEKPPNPKTGQELYDYYCKACHAKDPNVGPYLQNLPSDKKRMASYQVLMMLQYQDQPPHPPINLSNLREDKANTLAEFVVRLPPR